MNHISHGIAWAGNVFCAEARRVLAGACLRRASRHMDKARGHDARADSYELASSHQGSVTSAALPGSVPFPLLSLDELVSMVEALHRAREASLGLIAHTCYGEERTRATDELEAIDDYLFRRRADAIEELRARRPTNCAEARARARALVQTGLDEWEGFTSLARLLVEAEEVSVAATVEKEAGEGFLSTSVSDIDCLTRNAERLSLVAARLSSLVHKNDDPLVTPALAKDLATEVEHLCGGLRALRVTR